MKKILVGLSAAALLFMGAATTQADDRGVRDRGSNAGWRLGERNRDGYAIYRRERGNWYRVPGSAVAVGDGWVLGSQRESGGYAIYRWNGYGWDQAPGGAVQIGGSYNRPWVVNNRGQRFNWNGRDWNRGGFVGSNNSFRGNQRFDRDRYRGSRYDRGRRWERDQFRNRDRFRSRFFDHWDRSYDPYRFDERRRYRKDRRW